MATNEEKLKEIKSYIETSDASSLLFFFEEELPKKFPERIEAMCLKLVEDYNDKEIEETWDSLFGKVQ